MKKEIIRNRIMMDFIQASDQLIKSEGINNITLRKVANLADYNSATLYNYFENLDHLIFFSAMRHIKDYANALREYTKDSKNSMDRFIKVWECFCHYSFQNPEIYNAIFFSNLKNDMEEYVSDYYKLFPEDLMNADEKTSTMLLKSDITQRGMAIIRDCVEEGFIRESDGESLNEATLLIYEGLLKKVLNNKLPSESARDKTMIYIKTILKGMLAKDYSFD